MLNFLGVGETPGQEWSINQGAEKPHPKVLRGTLLTLTGADLSPDL